MNVYDSVLEIITTHGLIKDGERITVGFSGGVDSTVLLHILAGISENEHRNWHISAAHLNHKIRAEADGDEDFCRETCQNLGVSFVAESVDLHEYCNERGVSVETGGRECRYAFFRSLGDKTVLAHQKDDAVETVLFNIIRGTGLKGLAGMNYRTEIHGIEVMRPMLDISRSDIVAYASRNNIPYVEDSTNSETVYTRNKIRHQICTVMKEINPCFADNIRNLSCVAQYGLSVILEYLHSIKDEVIIEESSEQTIINNDKLLSCSPAVRMFLLHDIMERLGLDAGIQAVTRAEELAEEADAGTKSLQFTPHAKVEREYNRLIFSARSGDNRPCFLERSFPVPGECRIDEETVISAELIPYSGELYTSIRAHATRHIEFLDYGIRGKGPLKVRRRRAGDRFFPLGGPGEKKLKDFLIDEKVPASKRDSVLLVEKGDDIVWVVGIRISDRYKVTPSTKQVMRIEIKEAATTEENVK